MKFNFVVFREAANLVLGPGCLLVGRKVRGSIVVEFILSRFLADPSRLLADSASLWQSMGNVKPCRKNLDFNLKSSSFFGGID